MRKIALRNKAHEIIAYALVDDEDYERVMAAGPWHRNQYGYAKHSFWRGSSRIDGHYYSIFMHRLILGLDTDDPPVDHIDGNTLNNRRTNLRILSHAENVQNTRARRGSSSAYRGVSRRNDGWRAEVQIAKRRYYLGCFTTELAAAKAAAAFRKEHMPFSREAQAS